MAKKTDPPEPKLYVRTRPALRSTVKRLLLDLNETEVFAGRRYTLKQEVLIQALWLLAAEMDAADLAERLIPHAERVEALLKTAPKGMPAIETGPGTIVVTDNPTFRLPPEAKRKKSGR